MNRNDLIALKMFGEVLAREAKDLLNGEAREEWEGDNKTAVTWRTPFATAAAHISRPCVRVDDQRAFMAYLKDTYPGEIVDVPQVRNPDWLDRLLDDLVREHEENEGQLPPGTSYDPGGQYRQLNVVPDSTIKRGMARTIAGILARGELPVSPDDLYAFTRAAAEKPLAKLKGVLTFAEAERLTENPEPEKKYRTAPTQPQDGLGGVAHPLLAVDDSWSESYGGVRLAIGDIPASPLVDIPNSWSDGKASGSAIE